jgi:hypothetical protein
MVTRLWCMERMNSPHLSAFQEIVDWSNSCKTLVPAAIFAKLVKYIGEINDATAVHLNVFTTIDRPDYGEPD